MKATLFALFVSLSVFNISYAQAAEVEIPEGPDYLTPLILIGLVFAGLAYYLKREYKQVKPRKMPDRGEVGSNTSNGLEQKLDELNANLVFFKRFIVLITISLFVLMSWTALSATGSWWNWFGFLF